MTSDVLKSDTKNNYVQLSQKNYVAEDTVNIYIMPNQWLLIQN